MKKLIITGHGQYASGLKSSLELLAGQNEDLITIDFLAEMNEEALKQKMEEAIESFQDAECLFICDILGGTPFKNAAVLANHNDLIEVVAGCNLGSILEAIFQKEMLPLAELAQAMVDSSKNYTVKFKKLRELESVPVGDSLFEDGI